MPGANGHLGRRNDPGLTAYVSDAVGHKPFELFGKFTWKIENFSEISKRELRSAVFDVGSYKW